MSHALSPARHDTYVERRMTEKARKNERRQARTSKAQARARFA